jgi:vitamin B12 transporter
MPARTGSVPMSQFPLLPAARRAARRWPARSTVPASAVRGTPRRSDSPLVVALFASIGALAALQPARAQPGSLPATAALEPVVVTATREPARRDEVVADIVVIDGPQIAASAADSLEDLLRRAAGVQLSRNGGPGQSAAVFVRGSAANGTVVIVDGVRVGSATLGQAALEGLSLAQVERIEVLRGPASSLYGADAVGGVVRISTRPAAAGGDAAPALRAQARVGSFASREVAAALDGAGGGIEYGVGATRESSRGRSAVAPADRFGQYNPDDDGFSRTSARASVAVAAAPGHRLSASVLEARLDAQYDGAEFAPPTFASDPSPDFRNRLAQQVVSFDYRGAVDPRWTLTLGAGWTRDDLRSGGRTIDRFATERRQFTWQNALQTGPGQQWVLALDHLQESVDAAALGPVPQRTTTGAVVSWTGRFGAHRWQVDGRRDRQSVQGTIHTGKLGWGVDLMGGWALRAVAGTAYRVPTFNDLYFPNFGVATLAPERSRSVEAGVDWAAPGQPAADAARVGVTVFRNRVRDLIGFEPDPALCPAGLAFGCASNVSRARLQGLGVGLRWPLWRADGASLDAQAQLDWLDARDTLRNAPLPRRASHQQALSLSGRHGPWTASAEVVSVGPRPEGGQVLGAYQTLDAKLARRWSAHWTVLGSVSNAFDQRYQNALDYPALPRQWWIGLRYDGTVR